MRHFYECVCIIFILHAASVWSNLERQLELIRLVNSNPNSTWVAGRHDGVANDDDDDEPAASWNSTNHHTEQYQSTAKTKKWPGFVNLFLHSAQPESFDARKKWSSRCPTVKKVYNSGLCKCGWATSIAAVVSDRQCISSNSKFKYPLSAHYMMSCCKDCCSCNGGKVQMGWEFVRKNGLFSGGEYKSNTGCQPFAMPPCKNTYECSSQNSKLSLCVENKCIRSDIKTSGSDTIIVGSNTKTMIEGYYSFSREDPGKIMKDLMENGPIQVSMHMFEDFRLYTTGLYSHINGDFICDHGVKLIGWGAEHGNKYWLLLNSFGVLWGERGAFKIPMDLTDNSDYGFSIVAPKMSQNIAHTATLGGGCTFFICVAQIFRNCY